MKNANQITDCKANKVLVQTKFKSGKWSKPRLYDLFNHHSVDSMLTSLHQNNPSKEFRLYSAPNANEHDELHAALTRTFILTERFISEAPSLSGSGAYWDAEWEQRYEETHKARNYAVSMLIAFTREQISQHAAYELVSLKVKDVLAVLAESSGDAVSKILSLAK